MPKKRVIPEAEPEVIPEDRPIDEAEMETQPENDQTQVKEPAEEGGEVPGLHTELGEVPEVLAVEAGTMEPEEESSETLTSEENAGEGPEPEVLGSLDGECTGAPEKPEAATDVGDVSADIGSVEHEEESDDDGEAGDTIPQESERSSARKVYRRVRKAQPSGDADTETPIETEGRVSQPGRNERQTFYDLDFNALDRELSPEQRQEWNSIYASYRGRSALTGTIVGIDRHAISTRDRSTGEMVRQEMYCAIVIPFRVRILIPASEMWSREEARPDFVLRNMTGASIDFVVIHVDREAGFAIGSRRLALNTRRYYFSTQPSMNRSGARVKCRVLAVGPRRCLVECYGYDINLTQREMRYTAIPDLRDEYHPGQELDCIVKEYDREGGRLTISVKETNPNPFDGAELRHPEGSRRQAVIAGKYAGGVFCNLPDGVVVMCSYSFHYDDAAFAIGDKVIVAIQRYDFEKKQIYGKIVAKW